MKAVNPMMDGTAVKEFERVAQAALIAQARVVTVDGLPYSTTPLVAVRPPKDPEPAAIAVTTLSGVVEYVRENRDGISREHLSVLVVAPDEVRLVGPLLEPHQQRFVYVTAKAEIGSRFTWGHWYELEAAKIALLTQFEDTDDRAALIRLLANVVTKNSVRAEDDGIAQAVTVKGGVKVMANEVLKPTWALAPFRTFTEVAQPAALYLMRLKDDSGQGDIRVALYEADGGAWKREAIRRVQTWLRGELGEIGVPVIA